MVSSTRAAVLGSEINDACVVSIPYHISKTKWLLSGTKTPLKSHYPPLGRFSKIRLTKTEHPDAAVKKMLWACNSAFRTVHYELYYHERLRLTNQNTEFRLHTGGES